MCIVSVSFEISSCVFIIGIHKRLCKIGFGDREGALRAVCRKLDQAINVRKKSILFDFRCLVFSTSAVHQYIFPASQQDDDMQHEFNTHLLPSIVCPCLLPLYSTVPYFHPLSHGCLCLYTATQRFVNSAHQLLFPCLLQVYITVSIPAQM